MTGAAKVTSISEAPSIRIPDVRERYRWAVKMGARHNSRLLAEFLVLLLSYADADGVCHPSRATLASLLWDLPENATKTQMRTAIRNLDRRLIRPCLELGLIEVDIRLHDHADIHISNRYRVLVPDTQG